MEMEINHQICCVCGIDFWITKGFYDLRIQDHNPFSCPAGHEQSFIGETDAQKYKRLYNAEVIRCAKLLRGIKRDKKVAVRKKK